MKSSKIKKIIALSLCATTLISFASCGKKKKDTEESDKTANSEVADESNAAPTETTAATVATLPTYSGPMTNPNEVTWTETAMDPQIKYANVSEYLSVRSGPGTSYDQVGVLTRNQSVVVVAVATNSANEQWYKTQDGFYITSNSQYIVDNPV
ncbi:MAG: SH3 domain-containing protein [Saccharofermentans sp.]|nr:SH3 domain-containing protein [Saccharofermentans sp.]